jgi:hypothetical protein
MANVILKQCLLKRQPEGGGGEVFTLGWLDSTNLKEGYRVTLEDEHDSMWWDIVMIYSHGMSKADLHTEHESHLIHDKDHRRKMPGLNLGEVKK